MEKCASYSGMSQYGRIRPCVRESRGSSPRVTLHMALFLLLGSLPYFLSSYLEQAVEGALHAAGFGESIAELFHIDDPWMERLFGIVLIIVLVLINVAGVQWVVKLQFVLLFALMLAAGDFLGGSVLKTRPGLVNFQQLQTRKCPGLSLALSDSPHPFIICRRRSRRLVDGSLPKQHGASFFRRERLVLCLRSFLSHRNGNTGWAKYGRRLEESKTGYSFGNVVSRWFQVRFNYE